MHFFGKLRKAWLTGAARPCQTVNAVAAARRQRSDSKFRALWRGTKALTQLRKRRATRPLRAPGTAPNPKRRTPHPRMALRTVVLALLCLTPNARMSKAHKKSKELKEKEKLAEQKRIVERLYYAPYKLSLIHI